MRSGDTLWDIAETYYGGGWRYRAIVRDNRRKIRNPHWIYPEQKFHMPDAEISRAGAGAVPDRLLEAE